MEKNETFKMTYSAQQQEEIEQIRKKYTPQQPDKMEQLRALDASVGKKASARSIALGVIGSLILGIGMSLLMSEFGRFLGELAWPVGIGIGLLGMVLLVIAYPVYQRTLRSEREKIAPEILRLTDELSQ